MDPGGGGWRDNLSRVAAVLKTHAPRFKKAAGVVRFGLFAALVGIILWRINKIGVGNVLAHLPKTPWFYLLFLGAYFAVPAFEMLIYGPLWRAPGAALARALVQKRILNEGVLGYSGEAFFGWWAKTRLKLPTNNVFIAIKDSNFVSSFASTTATLALAYLVMLSGAGAAERDALRQHNAEIYSVLGGATLVIAFLYIFRRRLKLLSLDGPTLTRFTRVHFLRIAIVMAAQILQWSIAAPGVPIAGWLLLLAAYLLVTRIPFMPSFDLVLLGLGLSMSASIGASEDAVAGLFVANAGLSQALNLTLFLILGRPQSTGLADIPTGV